MPFTASHPAAVLPFLHHRLRHRTTPSALVAGSMVPDVALFAPRALLSGRLIGRCYWLAHDWLGLVTVDLALGLLVVAVWHALVGPALLAAVPGRARRRLGWCRPAAVSDVLGSGPALLRTAASVVVGAASHVGWDLFTHDGRWGARLVPWLHALHAGHSGASWAQMGSSVVGLAVIAVVVVAAARRSARSGPAADDGPGSAPEPLDPRSVPPVVSVPVSLLAVGLVALTALAAASTTGGSLPWMAYRAVTSAGFTAAVLVVALAAAWRLVTVEEP